MFKQLLKKFGPNPFEVILKKAQKRQSKKFLLFWNRGLGDIALGLYAIVHRIREVIPSADITFLTRPDLEEGFALLGGIHVQIVPHLRRGDTVNIFSLIDHAKYDVIIENPDPTHWVSWQLGKLTPVLHWQKEWDGLCEKFSLDAKEKYIGAHVQTETHYANWRDWPIGSWQELFKKITKEGKKVLLFGFTQDPVFAIPGVIDLRGKTSLFELLSLIKNRCETLIVPDSGVSSIVYYLNENYPIKHISLWSETHMGILKQNVSSPNKELKHIPIFGKNKDITTISAEEVYGYL